MTHVTCRLTAKNRDQLWNPTLGNRVRTTFFAAVSVTEKWTAVGQRAMSNARTRPQTHLKYVDARLSTKLRCIFTHLRDRWQLPPSSYPHHSPRIARQIQYSRPILTPQTSRLVTRCTRQRRCRDGACLQSSTASTGNVTVVCPGVRDLGAAAARRLANHASSKPRPATTATTIRTRGR